MCGFEMLYQATKLQMQSGPVGGVSHLPPYHLILFPHLTRDTGGSEF